MRRARDGFFNTCALVSSRARKLQGVKIQLRNVAASSSLVNACFMQLYAAFYAVTL